MKKILLTILAVFSISVYAFAVDENTHEKSMDAMMKGQQATVGADKMKAVEVGNKICPVSGEGVNETGTKTQYEYKGKIYNFCCPVCVKEFKKDPEKYIKIVKEQMVKGKGEAMENPMEESKETAEQEMKEGHRHMMAGKDADMMMDRKEGQPMMKAHEAMMKGDQAPVKEINLEAYQFGYSPDPIVVKKGDLVKIHATSRDVPHGVFIKEYGINKTVEKGKITDIEFVADKAGEFNIICSVYCGRGHKNMRGKLIVKE